ncbi:MAG: hypothetical protein ACXVLQ_09225 [Bacteriovorax sp.]
MDKSKNIFIKIDEFIFQKIDLFKTDSSFQKINEFLIGLEEDKQKLFAQIITFACLVIPYLFVMTLWWGNHKTKKNIEIKNQIMEQIATLNGNRDTLANVSSAYVSPVSIMGQEDFDNKIRNFMSAANIDQSKVHILNFNQVSASSNISKIEATVSFKNFGTQDFSNFMRSLIEQEKFKVLKINLIKDKTSDLLQGEISLMHLGTNPS